MASSNSRLLSQLQDKGYVVIPSLVGLQSLSRLYTAASNTTELARSGKWPFIRTMPKQFPPWPSTPPPAGIWGVQHLMHPDLPDNETFAESYFDPKLLSIIKNLLSCEENELVMELYNLLVRPEKRFELRWHRDDVKADATAEEEEQALGIHVNDSSNGQVTHKTYSHTQWNLALEPDDSLIVVPGSHRRARTDAERNAGPYDVLPGQLIVHLALGDAVFYDNNIVHRGVYSPKRERYTLHGSVGKTGCGDKRARNVLQHGVGDWVSKCYFGFMKPDMKAKAEEMRKHLLEMSGSSNVAFSHDE